MARMSIQSLDPAYFDDRLHFSFLESTVDPNGRPVPLRESKTTGIVRITNTGTTALDITEAVVTGPFSIVNPDQLLNALIAPGAFFDVTVAFDRSKYTPPTGTRDQIDRISTVYEGVLTLRSNDPTLPVETVDLAGFWQQFSEQGVEPNVNEIFRVFGFGNFVEGLRLQGAGQLSTMSKSDLYVKADETEVLSPYWTFATPGGSARMTAIAAYHGPTDSGTMGIHAPGDVGNVNAANRANFFSHALTDSQQLLPNISTGPGFATRVFTAANVPAAWAGDGVFGFRVENLSSDPRQNPTGNILVDVNDVQYTRLNATQARAPNGATVLISSLDLKQQGQFLKIFQAVDRNGVAIPNVYIGMQDYVGLNYDYNDNIFIIEGVRPVGFASGIAVSGLDGAAVGERLVFTNIDVPNTSAASNALGGQVFRNEATFTLTNDGIIALPITSIALGGANPGAFQIVSAPTSIAAGGSAQVTVRFVGTDPGIDLKATPYAATLTIRSRGIDEATRVIQLAGIAQDRSEQGEEPTVQQIVDAFGYRTNVGQALLDNDSRIERVGDEVLIPYFERADSGRPVEITQIGSFLQQTNVAGFFVHGLGGISQATRLFSNDDQQGQTVLPDGLVAGPGDTGQTAGASFAPSQPFGVRIAVDGRPTYQSWSDPVANQLDPVFAGRFGAGEGHLVRYFLARDAAGAVIADTYIGIQDYPGATTHVGPGAYDYNDHVFIIRNVRPHVLTAANDANGDAVNDAFQFDDDADGLLNFFDPSFNPAPNAQRPFTPDNRPWAVDADGVTVFGRNFDAGGQGVAYSDNTAARIGNTTFRPTESVDISTNPAQPIGNIEAGEWVEYTVNVERSGVHMMSVTGATPWSGRSVTATFARNGVVYETETFTQTRGAWGSFVTTAEQAVGLTAGLQVVRLTFNNSGQDLLSFSIDPTDGLFV